MTLDMEETLRRELQQVAATVSVPAMPALPVAEESSGAPSGLRRSGRHTMPLLAAAAVVALIAGTAVVANRGSEDIDPRPAIDPDPTPTQVPTPTPTSGPVSTAAPEVPYVLDGVLRVDGAVVPGTWAQVWSAGDTWIGLQTQKGRQWSWGQGATATALEGDIPQGVKLSPRGELIAYVVKQQGDHRAVTLDPSTGEIAESGDTLAVGPNGPEPYVKGVTDDGKVVASDGESDYLIRPGSGAGVVTLDNSLWWMSDVVTAGVVATDVDGDPNDPDNQQFVSISDSGEVTDLGPAPRHDALTTSPNGDRIVWAPMGSLGGEGYTLSTLEHSRVGGGDAAQWAAPAQRGFELLAWVWEDDDHLVAVTKDKDGTQAMARCRVTVSRCVALESP